ncbi:unnamed protein product [Caenorhabditis auriculariae]|uniref:DNA topoisomerase (ATP-hydrolyzing) n=1 Tax=Caenorhabditis auriculariae TaxID=2777116 RepID=A0A8S1GSZ9_9PELO|nr:unnamed protein product [Caenorhabditis auriculariae]
MAFDREKAEERRRWIESVPATSSEDLPSDGSSMSFKDFVDGEMMRFGLLDLQRSIPSVVDGLKPSQRKVLYTLLKRDSDKEIKVSQLAGAVAHSQAYHHGEEALVNTIVRMAQNFCGANNLALLEPIGQFGTRHEGGHDAASARYIFTNLSPLARILFPAEDDLLLERLQDDGQLVEPKWLCPILPLVLINGAEGIGTGWATKIANRNVQNVCDAVKMMIEKADRADVGDLLLPHYEGFTGQIQKLDSRRYFSTGKAEFAKTSRKNDLCVNITELPVGVWTSKYKEKLNTFLKDGLIGGFSESHTEKSVRFSVEMLGKATRNLDLQRFFKLQSTFTEHLVLFNAEGVLKRYPNVLEIATEHFVTRKGLYEKRRELLLRESSAKLKYLENQARFVENLVNGSLKVTGRKREEVEIQMKQFGFETNPVKILKKQLPIDQLDFAYLLEMPMSRLTKEEIEKLDEKAQKQRKERDSLDKSQWQQTWTTEIEKFEKFSRF